jgi:Helix-turn-helix domain
MKRQDVAPGDVDGLERAAAQERAAREQWNRTLVKLARQIRLASQHGASLRSIASAIGRSHGRVRELLRGEEKSKVC